MLPLQLSADEFRGRPRCVRAPRVHRESPDDRRRCCRGRQRSARVREANNRLVGVECAGFQAPWWSPHVVQPRSMICPYRRLKRSRCPIQT